MFNILAEKLSYLFLLSSLFIGKICVNVVKIFSWLIPNPTIKKDFLFFPYTHKDNSGTISRFQEYLPFLDRDNYTYEIHYISSMQHYDWVYHIPKKNKARENWFYHQMFWNRFFHVLSAKKFKAVFYQRSLFPDYYNQSSEVLEGLLRKIHNNITVDYFDADYVRNEKLIREVVSNCDKVSLVNNYLAEYFSKIHSKIFINDLSIQVDRYKQKLNYQNQIPIRIYWTGGVSNAVNLNLIIPVLEKLNQKYPLVLVMICRTNAGFKQSFIEQHPWQENSYVDYLINSDIAIYPALKDDEHSRGKVAYKALEYAAAKVPIVASPQGLTSRFIDDEDVLIANNENEWFLQLEKLITSESLRQKLASSAYEKLIKYHDVNNTYKNFLDILKA